MSPSAPHLRLSSAQPRPPALSALRLSLCLLCALWLCVCPCVAQNGTRALLQGAMVLDVLGSAYSYHFYSYRPSTITAPVDVILVERCPGFCHLHLIFSPLPLQVVNYQSPQQRILEGPAHVRIAPNDPWSCATRNLPLDACVYYFTVDNWQPNVPYALIAQQPPAMPELPPGQPTTLTLPPGGASHLFLLNSLLHSVVTLALSVGSGDCDLFVSAVNRAPSASNSSWRSDDAGDDVVAIDASVNPLPSRVLYYFVGVVNKLTSASSTCTIIGGGYSADSASESAWYLTEGKAQPDVALANTFRYYVIYLGGVWDVVTITLDSLRGDADLYVNIGSHPSPFLFTDDTQSSTWPNRTHSQYNSTRTGSDRLDIAGPQQPSLYAFISVYSKAVDSHYSIRVSAGPNRIPNIAYGGAQEMSLARGSTAPYVYSAFNWTEESANDYLLTFTLATSSGNADLYISDTYLRPNRTHCNWTSELVGDGLDVAVLRSYALTPYGRPELSPGKSYYVSVYASTASVYSLYAAMSPRRRLYLNTAVSLWATPGSLIYAELDVPRAVEVVIRLTPNARYGAPGDITAYLSSLSEPNPDVPQSYQQRGRETLRVPASSACPEQGCRYYLALQRDAAQFTSLLNVLLTTLSPQLPAPRLLLGVAMDGGETSSDRRIPEVDASLYRFNVSCSRATVRVAVVFHSDLSAPVFAVTNPMDVNRGPAYPLAGSDNVLFGFDEVQWSGARTAVLTFDWKHPAVRAQSMQGEYLLSVLNWYGTYTLLLSVENGDCSPVQAEHPLPLLVPVTASTAGNNGYAYFVYTSAAAHNATTGSLLPAPLYFSVTPVNGSTTSAQPAVLSLVARGDGRLATVEDAQWRADSSGVLALSSSSCATESSGACTYTLAVRSSTASSFQVLASSVAGVRPLDVARLMSTPSAGSVARGAVVAYAASVSAASSSMSLVVEACVGSVSLWVSYRDASGGGGNTATAALPTAASNAGGSATVTSPFAVPVPAAAVTAGSAMLASIGGVGATNNAYEVRVLSNVSWADASPTLSDAVLKLTSYASTPSGLIRVRIPTATMPRAVASGALRQPAGSTNVLLYSVYVLDKTDTSGVNLRSQCGAKRGATLVSSVVLTAGSSSPVDVKPPRSGSALRYSLVVHVQHAWRTGQGSTVRYEPSSAAYASYAQLDDTRTGTLVPEPTDDDSSSGGDGALPAPSDARDGSGGALSGALLAGVVLGALAVLVVAAFLAQRWWNGRRKVLSSVVSIEGLLTDNDAHFSALQQLDMPIAPSLSLGMAAVQPHEEGGADQCHPQSGCGNEAAWSHLVAQPCA